MKEENSYKNDAATSKEIILKHNIVVKTLL